MATSSTASIGVVTAVDFTGDVPVLTIGSRRVAITDVTDVRLPDVTAKTPEVDA